MKKKKNIETGAPAVMSLYYALMTIAAKTNQINAEAFATFETRLRAFLAHAANSEIRLFFGYSNNLGHRATTIGIMNRLIAYFPANTNRTIRLIYDVDPEDRHGPTHEEAQGQFADAMVILIPGITVDNVLEDHTYQLTDRITLHFNCYDQRLDPEFDPPLTTDAYFAISGGYDDTKNITETIKVECLLTLQPYQFTKYLSLNTVYFKDTVSPNGILLGPKYNKAGTIIKIAECVYGTTFTKRAYYLPDPVVSDALWQKFQERDAARYAVVRRLIALKDAGTIDFMPLYYSEGRLLCSNPVDTGWGSSPVLISMTTGLFRMKELRQAAGVANRCSVVVVFGGITDRDYAEFNRIRNEGEDEMPRLSGFLAGMRNTYTNHYRQLDENAQPDAITTAVTDVGTGGIVIVRLGKVPLYINNYLFSVVASLPAVYEGEGSASLILNSGKPFLHLVSADLIGRAAAIQTNQLYPTVPLTAANSVIANQCHVDSLAMVQSYAQWEAILLANAADRPTPNRVVGQFLFDSYRAGTDRYNYFATIRPFFHSPIQDKLMLALLYALAEISARDNQAEEPALKMISYS